MAPRALVVLVGVTLVTLLGLVHARVDHRSVFTPTPELRAVVRDARALPDPDARREAIVGELIIAAEDEPGQAIALALELAPDEGRDEALHEAIGHLLICEPNAAHELLQEYVGTVGFEARGALARAAVAVDRSLVLRVPASSAPPQPKAARVARR